MTGPEHYREAERLLSGASFTSLSGNPVTRDGTPMRPETHAALIARAQAHAQLAAVAAHVFSQPVEGRPDSAGLPEEEWDDWCNTVSATGQYATTKEN
ncbi:hypothetical protein [Streptomyces sp. PD-S100-1]|uniref:hypothetical protein n=1 Tax=Streptomyces sp. PD-S100-1 TaxID=3394351 RepID=UPI0039BC47B2